MFASKNDSTAQSELCKTPAMSNVARFPIPAKEEVSGADPRTEGVLHSIRMLISNLGVEERQRVLKYLTDELRPVSGSRAGDVLGTIVRLLPRKGSWTMAAFKEAVEKEGIEAKPKEVYNAVGYLSKTGRITRVSYGRYVVDGMAIETGDDLGGEPNPNHEDSDS